MGLSVIPAQAGIQNHFKKLDPGLRRGDDWIKPGGDELNRSYALYRPFA